MTGKLAKPGGFLMAAWVTLCLAVSILLAALWLLRQPAYDGRPVSYWFKQLPVIYHITPTPNTPAPTTPAPRATGIADYPGALAAIRAIGTNSLPLLISKLQARAPPRLIRLIRSYAGNWPVIRTLFPPQDQANEQWQAVAGLLVLCPLPPQAEQKLRILSVDLRGPCWFQAYYVLKANNDPAMVRDILSPYK
jgi:hypothetical protein